MHVLLSILPILLTIMALGLGARTLHAALLGVAAAVIAIFLAFPIPAGDILPIMQRWAPILAEVLLIVLGGLLLAETLRVSGAQAALASWVEARSGQGNAAVLLVVHGITPFAESLTGFGIGVTIGIPLLAHFGLPPRRVAMIGLLGLCAVPWGSMGPGTLIAATMAGLSFHDLGVASAIVSLVPFVVTGIAASVLANPSTPWASLWQGALSGGILTLSVVLANAAFGTAAAGALGALMVIGLHFLRGQGRTMAPLADAGRRALGSYAVLLGGILVTGWVVQAMGWPESWRYAASPALWLFVAALWFSRMMKGTLHMRRTWASWLHIAPVTGLFIVLGILMAASGMATYLAQRLAGAGMAYLAAAPFVGAMGGFVTGSNSGANAMFATTQAEIARSLGVNVLWFMAVHNVAAAFLLMASPGKIELAVQLASADAREHRRAVQTTMLRVAFAVVAILAAVNLMLALL